MGIDATESGMSKEELKKSRSRVHMTKEELRIVEKFINPTTVMLEYGSGGSTFHFSKLVKKLYTIEHDREWYEKVSANPRSGKDFEAFLVDIKKSDIPKGGFTKESKVAESWDSLEESTRYGTFKDYIEYPAKLGIKFDACLIDGRARPECAKFIYDFLNEGAIVFIHDYAIEKRRYYKVVEERYEVVEKVTLHNTDGNGIVALRK